MSANTMFERQIEESTAVGILGKFRPLPNIPNKQYTIEAESMNRSVVKEVLQGIVTHYVVYWTLEPISEGEMTYQKRRSDLLVHLESLKSKEVITDSDKRKIMSQHALLEQRRQELVGHMGEVVVVCNGELFFGKNLNEAVAQAKEKHGEKPYYSETVNMVDYPSPFG